MEMEIEPQSLQGQGNGRNPVITDIALVFCLHRHGNQMRQPLIVPMAIGDLFQLFGDPFSLSLRITFAGRTNRNRNIVLFHLSSYTFYLVLLKEADDFVRIFGVVEVDSGRGVAVAKSSNCRNVFFEEEVNKGDSEFVIEPVDPDHY